MRAKDYNVGTKVINIENEIMYEVQESPIGKIFIDKSCNIAYDILDDSKHEIVCD